MKNMKISLVIGLLLVVSTITNFGCAYTVKRTNFSPIEANGWTPLYDSKSGHSRFYYKCGSFQIEAHFIPITDKTYSIGPIVPIIPIYDKGVDKSKNMLKIELVLDGDFPNNIFSENSIGLIFDKNSNCIKPYSVKVNFGKPQEREYYDFVFAVEQETVREFTIIFTKALAGCSVPPLKYAFKDLGVVYDVLSN
jgi:hypothetical protein